MWRSTRRARVFLWPDKRLAQNAPVPTSDSCRDRQRSKRAYGWQKSPCRRHPSTARSQTREREREIRRDQPRPARQSVMPKIIDRLIKTVKRNCAVIRTRNVWQYGFPLVAKIHVNCVSLPAQLFTSKLWEISDMAKGWRIGRGPLPSGTQADVTWRN